MQKFNIPTIAINAPRENRRLESRGADKNKNILPTNTKIPPIILEIIFIPITSFS